MAWEEDNRREKEKKRKKSGDQMDGLNLFKMVVGQLNCHTLFEHQFKDRLFEKSGNKRRESTEGCVDGRLLFVCVMLVDDIRVDSTMGQRR